MVAEVNAKVAARLTGELEHMDAVTARRLVVLKELRAMGATKVHFQYGDLTVELAPISAPAEQSGAELEQLRQDNHRLANELELQREARRVERGDY